MLLFTTFLHSQTSVLKGNVKDSQNKITLVGVNIIINDSTGTSTNANGNYELKLKPGNYNLVFKSIGYVAINKQITILADETKILNVEMLAEVRMLDALVISAQRYEQKISDVTVSMELIKPHMIENNNISSLEQALQKVPGVFITDDQASIRGGSGYSYGAGSRVLLMLDDMPLLTGASGEARWDFAPLENIHQVEILKGASSAIYGSSALNGVINIRTKFPSDKPTTSILMYNGIYGNPKRNEIKWWNTHSPFYSGIRFNHSQKIGNLDLVFGGNLQSENSFRENDNEQILRFNFNLRYRHKKIEGLSYGVNTNVLDRTGDTFLLWLNGDSGVWRANPSFQQHFHNKAVNLNPYLSFVKNSKTSHHLKTRLYRFNSTNNTNQSNYDDLYFLEYQLQKRLKINTNLISGSSFSYNESNSEIFGNTKHFGSNLSIYSQLEQKFYNRLNFSLGFRFEGYRLNNEEMKFRPVYRTGLNYKIDERTFIRTSYGLGFRYPTIAERYTATSTGDIRIFPNPNLKDETGWSAEIGIKRGFKISSWSAYYDVALFWTQYKDMIEFTFGYHNPDSVQLVAWPQTDPNFFLNWVGFKAQNIENARINGVDFTVTGEGKLFGLDAVLLAGYTFTNPVNLNYVNVDSLKNSNQHILKYRFYHNAKIDLDVKYKKLTLGVNAEFCSNIINIDKAFEDSLRAPNGQAIIINNEAFFLLPGLAQYRANNNKGFNVVDVRIAWNISDNTKMTAVIKNVFNKEYMIRPADIRPPRTFVIQLNVKI